MVLISSADISDQVQYLDEPATGRARTALTRLRSSFSKLALVRLATAVKSDSNKFVIFTKLLETQFANLVYVSELLTGQRLY